MRNFVPQNWEKLSPLPSQYWTNTSAQWPPYGHPFVDLPHHGKNQNVAHTSDHSRSAIFE